jgi:ABC-type Na+ efflux pump permease subunit
VRAKITVKFLFAATQSLIAFSALILAALLNFNLLNTQTSLNIHSQALSFYVVMIIIFGVTFLISALFLIYDWWENR